MKFFKRDTISVFFIIIFIIANFSCFFIVYSLINNNHNDIIKDFQKIEVEYPKTNGYWNLTGIIHIDDTNPTKNWSYTAATYDWCNGSGTWNDPYILENITIDGLNTSGVIVIENSDIYFTIRNCTVYNSTSIPWFAGIFVGNATNGHIINSDVSHNYRGIFVYKSSNITVTGNTVYGNSEYGINIDESSNNLVSGNNAYNNVRGFNIYNSTDNEITSNSAYDNTEYGINVNTGPNNLISGNSAYNNDRGLCLEDSDGNDMLNNRAYGNDEDGILIHYSDNNNIIGNSVYQNHDGIYLDHSNNNNISENTINDNTNIGIWLYYSNYNTITGNTFTGNGLCINEEGCEGNQFGNNEGCPYGENLGLILIIILIISLSILGALIYINKKGLISKYKEKRKEKKVVPIQTLPKSSETEASKTTDIIEPTKSEIEELERTEAEVGVETQEFNCIVHKGPIVGDKVYICPNCRTFYCIKCANVLRDKGEKCWSCDSEIQLTAPIAVPTQEKQDKIQKLEERIISLKKTVKDLDDNFYEGALGEEDYNIMRNPLIRKIADLNKEIEELRE